jgi:hypothetical protein
MAMTISNEAAPEEGRTRSDDEGEMRVTREEATKSALELLRRRPHGVLGTLSRTSEGAPFGSVAPYALDRFGAPLVYVAGIAEHTRNLKADPRVSLLVHDEVPDGQDIQTCARLCVMGTAAPVAEAEAEDAWARYRARLPAADGYRRTHDFSLWRLEPARLRWIGGFGEIFWLRPDDFRLRPEADPLHDHVRGIVDHMNEDHVDAIQTFYEVAHGTRPEAPRMVGIDTFGMDFEDELGRLRVDFATPATPESVRMEVIDALERARARLPAK